MIAHWTTSGVVEREQFAFWREAVGTAFVPLTTEGHTGRFEGRINSSALPGLGVSTVAADPHLSELTSDGVRQRTESPFFANLVLDGEIAVQQFIHRQKLRMGDIYVLDTASPFKVHFGSRFKILCVTLDENIIRHRLGPHGRFASPVIRGDNGSGPLISHYIRGLQAMARAGLPDAMDMAAHQLGALLATATSGTQADSPDPRGKRHAALRRVLNYLEAHLADETLDVQSACRALGMSRTHLYEILADSEETFWAYVRNRRLDECHRTIRDSPRRTITDICTTWGFADQSSFTRMFKARFGRTPGQLRHGATQHPSHHAHA